MCILTRGNTSIAIVYNYSDCRETLEGLDYTGNISITISGHVCQRWEQEPHAHPYIDTFDDRYLSVQSNHSTTQKKVDK